MDETVKLLERRIVRLQEYADTLDPGSAEHSDAVAQIDKLSRDHIEYEKVLYEDAKRNFEYALEKERQKHDTEMRKMDFKHRLIEIGVGLLATLAPMGLNLAAQASQQNKIMDFEEHGALRSKAWQWQLKPKA